MADKTPDEWDHRTNAAAASSRRFQSSGPAQYPHGDATPSAGLGARLADITATEVRRAPGAPGSSMRFLLAHLPLILAVTLVAVGGAALLAWSQTSVYQSVADVVVEPASTTAASQQAVDMGTEKGIASSGSVIAIASQSLGVPEDQLDSGLSISVPVDTDLLQIAYSYPNRREARRRAQGIAEAYVAFRSPQSPSDQAKNAKSGQQGNSQKINTPQASIVTNASLPKGPSSPDRLVDLIVAVVVGLGLGLGIALIRDRMDDRLRGPLDFEKQADAPVLALIPPLRLRSGDDGIPPVTIRGPDSLVAEAYRSLRTRVLQVAAVRRAKTLLVTSPAWEEKTTIAANLAIALAQPGRVVVLVCADLRWGFAHELFGLDNHSGVTSLLDGKSDLAPALRSTDRRGLVVLPAGPAVHDPGGVLQGHALRRALGELHSRADFVVVDAPPVLATADVVALAELTEMILLVADARQSTRSQVRAAVHELEHVREKLIGCVLDNVGRAVRLPKGDHGLLLRPFNPVRSGQRAANSYEEPTDSAPQRANAQVPTGMHPRPPVAPTNAVSGQ